MGYCKLLQGGYAYLLQIVLALLAFCSLLLKKKFETPQRAWVVWALDVSKQLLSAACAHLIAILFSLYLSSHSRVEYQCGWYLISFINDTTLGVLLSYCLLKLIELIAQKNSWENLSRSGNYVDKHNIVDFRSYYLQLGVWVLIVVISKSLCGCLLVSFSFVFTRLASGLCNIFSGHPNLMLAFVMLIGPLCLNTVQALLQDWFLKYNTNRNFQAEALLLD